jgi:ATP-dependent Clp protease ATP-binding subunit ClpA
MLERFTKRARTAVVAARGEAQTRRAASVRAHHLLLALTHDPQCLAMTVLVGLGATADRLRDAVERQAAVVGDLDQGDVDALAAIGIDVDEVLERLGADGPPVESAEGRRRRLPFSSEARKSLELALREARALKNDYIGTEHLLLALLRDRRTPAAAALGACDVGYDDVRTAVVEALRGAG